MTVASDEQLTRLRTRPQRTTLHLSVYEPNTALAAQINMPAISRGDRVIDISILGGDFNTVKRGMTCYIGTTPNGQDVDRIRAITCSSTQITVAENDMNLRDGMFLTVVWFYEPWAVFPRITISDDFIPAFYKDYDIEFDDQTQFMDPVVHMGPNQAMFLDNTPTGSWASMWYTSSGTFDPTDDSIPTGYAWTFEGGMPTASFVPDPGYIEYTGAGHFLTSLEVHSNFGKVFTARRHVSVYTRPDQGPARPIVRWGMSTFEGSRDNGGYSVRLWIREEADFSRVVDGALIVIFSEDAQGATQGAMGGNAENRSTIFFNGYIEDESIAINPVTNRLEFRVVSITQRMKQLAGFSMTLESKKSADTDTWNDMTNMTVDKASIAFLRWQSTILTIADYHPTGDDLNVQFMDWERSNIYDAVNNLLASTLVATAVADRQGKIWTEIDANVRPTGSARNIDTAISITRQDWRSALDITVLHEPVLSYLEMGGIAYDGPTTGSSDPFLAGAPGDAPAYFGGMERVSGLVIEGQTQLNELVGLAWARANQDFPEFLMPMAGDYRILDIAPQERVLVSLVEDDTYRGYVWDEKPFLPTSIQYSYQAGDQVVLQDLTLTEETDGPPGETVEIPVDPPFPQFILPEINLPPLILPPPIDPLPIDPAPGTGDLAYAVTSAKLTRTRNLLDDTPIWEDLPIPGHVTGSNSVFKFDPIDPQNIAYMKTWHGVGYDDHLYKITNLDSAAPTWTEIVSSYSLAVVWGQPTAYQFRIYDFDISPMNNQLIYVCGSTQALSVPNAYVQRSFDGGASWTWNSATHFNLGRTQDAWNRIYASEHGVANSYFMGGNTAGTVDHFLWSADAGSAYSDLWASNCQHWHVPYQGNAADLGLYMTLGQGSTKQLYYSETRGTVASRINITPQYLGVDHAVKRGGGDASPYGGVWKDNVTTHPTNRLWVAALLNPKLADGAADNLSRLFISTNGPENLEIVADFDVGSNKVCSAFRWHRTNPNVMTITGKPHSLAMTPGRILVSQDGGSTWIDKFPSWYNQIMGGVGTMPGFRVTDMVWTV